MVHNKTVDFKGKTHHLIMSLVQITVPISQVRNQIASIKHPYFIRKMSGNASNSLCPYQKMMCFLLVFGTDRRNKMQRIQLNTRIKKIVVDRLKLIAVQENRTLQDLLEEIIELGIIEYLKGGHNVKN